MGFLNPLFLLAGLAIAIPLLIHLLHRQRIRDIIFPALIYLKRTEREHARRVKIRQLLVLLLRIAAILLLALAGARPFLSGAGSAHPPTALAIVLDNSASSGLVLEDERALDRLQAGALEAVRRANDQDRIWVLRAGEPWDVVVPLGREAALDRIAATEVSGGHADISAAVQRAVALVSTSDLGAHEVHVLSDLQKSGLPDTVLVQGDGTPILVWTPNWDVPWNGSVGSARVGGGLPPIQGQPTDVTSRVQRVPASNDSTSVRLWMGGEVRGAARASGDAEVVFPVPVVRDDHLSGFVERDPDQLVADDRHYFVAQASTAPSIVIDGNPGGFVLDALEVLEASGRLVRANVNGDVLVAVEGRGAARAGSPARAVLLLPPTDPVRLPGFNQRLRSAGLPWQVQEDATPGTWRVQPDSEQGEGLPLALAEVEVTRRYLLVPTDGAAEETDVLARLEGGEPWVVQSQVGDTRYLLLSTPFALDWTNLPVTSVMVPFTEWWAARWSRGLSREPAHVVGATVMLPDSVQSVADPDGTLLPLEAGEGEVRLTRAGMYQLFGAPGGERDGLLREVAVNVNPFESDLSRADDAGVLDVLGADADLVDADDWASTVYSARQGPELWRLLVVALLLVLVAESLAAASGRAEPEPVIVRA